MVSKSKTKGVVKALTALEWRMKWSKLLNDAWRKVTEGCKFSLTGGVPEPNGLIWYMIAIHISVHISSSVGPTQGRRQLQRRWKKVHLASVVTDVSVYLHVFLHRPGNGRDYIPTCFSLQLAQNLERVHPHTQYLGYNEGLGSGLPTSSTFQQSFLSFSTLGYLFVFFSLHISLIRDIDPALIEMETYQRIW